MQLLFFGLGLIFGSFNSALIWRIYKQSKEKDASKKYSVVTGRSMCPKCGHKLGPIDLIPLFSWISTGGRCRYCKEPISWQYPVIELITGTTFLLSYVYWPRELIGSSGWILFGLWLLSTVLFVALTAYDVRWMLLPDRLMKPLAIISLSAAALMLTLEGVAAFRSIIWGVIIGFGFFYLLFQMSSGRWIGGGDVKFGLVMGLWLGAAKTALALLLAFYGAAVFILPLMLIGRVSRKSQIPFGPFLILATFVAFLFGDQLIEWYQRQFLYSAY